MALTHLVLPMLLMLVPLMAHPSLNSMSCLFIRTPDCTKHAVGSLHPHEEGCQFFYRCNENREAIGHVCPDGYNFQGHSGEICVASELVQCRQCPPRMQSTYTGDECLEQCAPFSTCSYSGEWLPYPPDCSQYIYCNENLNPVVTPCWNDYYFSVTEGTCVPQEQSGCQQCAAVW
ncbi:hypothetical protein B566_EDAN007848 [Ephemera danica]|nr:hypothetical protein B566_EDAN007848 [Ephemera danica]